MVEFVTSNSSPPTPTNRVKNDIPKKTDAPEDADETLREMEASCDTPKKPIAFYLTFTGLIVAIFLYSLDATTLVVAIPYIAEDLGGSTLESFWASMSYILLVVLTQPLYTTFSDIFGRKPLLLAAFFFSALALSPLHLLTTWQLSLRVELFKVLVEGVLMY
ncbi:hypothetical protein DSL72_008938 [Monilinia vaccinii-corymbosi]|uniref:Major facilitator superfamily (MFS) profile domain-containing protein n=1 Tax=Monilinia vaccinii-corymbosi TaxID=61207 RepID=A0A8A3PQS3_9HELO|nr:hypothetical protein DSL72_008938 [Monilinia vaccinii-corymbosi]